MLGDDELHDENGFPDIKVKFDRSAAQELLNVGKKESIVITGQTYYFDLKSTRFRSPKIYYLLSIRLPPTIQGFNHL